MGTTKIHYSFKISNKHKCVDCFTVYCFDFLTVISIHVVAMVTVYVLCKDVLVYLHEFFIVHTVLSSPKKLWSEIGRKKLFRADL